MIPYQPKKLDIKQLAPRPVLDDISVVIPTLGRAILEESLYWIVCGSSWPNGLAVVDQGDNPRVAEWIELLRSTGMNARHIFSSQRGRAAGINRGLEMVETRFVAITDDDCFVDANWLKTIAIHLRDKSEAVVTGRVEAAGEDVVFVVISRMPVVYHRPRLKFDSMSGGNMATSMSVIERVGLFDEASFIRTAEDADWAYRALRAGIPIIYVPELVVKHFGWRDERERVVMYKDYARSHGGFYGKHLRKGDLFIALRAIIHHVRALRRWLWGVFTNDREIATIGRAYLTGLLPGMIAGIKRS